MFALALAAGRALRGGADVGVGFDIDPGEVYGAALVRAHDLEHDFAQYPRILLGDELMGYLDQISRQEPRSLFGTVAKEQAKNCLELVSIDTDRLPVLDFLSQGMRRLEPTYSQEILPPAYRFVVAEYARHYSEGNLKLASRYGRLRTFMEVRLPAWGIDYESLARDALA
jgi:hypothetical protein